MHDVVFGRSSMTEKFQNACMNKYEQMFIRCSYYKWLARFLCLLFKACCLFLADKMQNKYKNLGFVNKCLDSICKDAFMDIFHRLKCIKGN